MSPSARCAAGLAAVLLLLADPAPAGPRQDVTVVDVLERTSGHRLAEADVVYPLAVLESAGWERARVERAIAEVEGIFGQCGITVSAGSVYRLAAPEAFRELDESMQARLLAELPPTRPIALLVDRTADGDTAYSYRMSAPVASRGTAWVTRNSQPACLAPSLAHELGHILLDSPRHSGDRRNLMSHTCTVSNVAGSRPGTELTDSQCGKLRARWFPPGAALPQE